MRTVEITYRYGELAALVRPRPADADAARLRLDEGNRAFAGLLDTLAADSGTARRTSMLIRGTSVCFPARLRRNTARLRRCSAALMRGCRSS